MFGYKGISMISLNFTNRLTKIATFLKDWKAVINTGSNHGIMTSPLGSLFLSLIIPEFSIFSPKVICKNMETDTHVENFQCLFIYKKASLNHV